MRVIRLCFALVAALWIQPHVGKADELPEQIQSHVCQTAPVIDGVIGDDEWQAAPPIEFEMKLVQLNSPTVNTRSCQLRVMNSANGLYLALRVPDTTVDNSLSPLRTDVAILAFCQGPELRSGDDRKVMMPGLYVDKHFAEPGKDADDSHQDGRGAMAHEQGSCVMEWAVPLSCDDTHDVQLKPGDTVQLNLGYFDAFQGDLKGTQVGVVWPGDLDHAANWGTLQLAADVPDDGARVFKGPAWVESLFADLASAPGNRLRFIESAPVTGAPQLVAKALVEYPYLDTQGQEKVGKAKLYLPASVQDGTTRFPLYYSAGYELDDRSSLMHLQRGFVVVSPRELKDNPLVQTINPDAALLHIVRSLPFVDDARVVIGGGSAGGYMTLMLAAETFPLAGAAADVPPVNWGYNAAYFLQRKKWTMSRDQASADQAPRYLSCRCSRQSLRLRTRPRPVRRRHRRPDLVPQRPAQSIGYDYLSCAGVLDDCRHARTDRLRSAKTGSARSIPPHFRQDSPWIPTNCAPRPKAGCAPWRFSRRKTTSCSRYRRSRSGT